MIGYQFRRAVEGVVRAWLANVVQTVLGLNVGTATGAGTGNTRYSGDLQPGRNSTYYTGYVFVPLTAPLTSTDWDGDARSTTAATLIDLSAVFGAPAGIKAVLVRTEVRDSGSAAATDLYFDLGPAEAFAYAFSTKCGGLANDAYTSGQGVVPCDANGDVWYRVAASGANTMDVDMRIVGYWI